MKQSVFNLNTLKAHPERNAFDLSHNDVFSCAPGMLLPISCTEVLPNEHYEINPQVFLRTMPLNSAAYVRMRQHVEFFFVPARVLLRQFPQFVVGTKYPISSLDTLNDYAKDIPSVSLATLRSLFIDAGSSSDGLGIPAKYGHLRLFDLLGYGLNSSRSITADTYPDSYVSAGTTQSSPKLSILRFAAYQKVYQDYYRNPYWEPADASIFNYDDKFGQTLSNVSADKSRLFKLVTLRYRNWTKDFFTSVQPQFQGAPFVTKFVDMKDFMTSSSFLNGNNFVADTNANVPNTTLPFDNSSASNMASLAVDSSDRMSIPVHNIRAAFALDKLYRLQQQSGNGSYGEQIRNRFGFGGVHDDWKSQYIGGSSAPISIGEVLTTANTFADGEALGLTGDIYGKASSVNDGKFVFDTKEHGFIMGIFSVVPDADYNSTQIDPHNFKLTFEQFYQPEFDRLGHQPLNSYFLSTLAPLSAPEQPDTLSKGWLQRVLGFQNRYLEYKTGIDRVHGQFCTFGSLSAWTAPRNSGILDNNSTYYNLYSLKVSPKILNSIVSVTFDGSEYTDPILVNSHISIKAVRPMSVSDEPLL